MRTRLFGITSRMRAALAPASALLLLHGCIGYEERGTLQADGSGRLAVAMGVPTESDDPAKASEAVAAVKRLRGLEWVQGVDSGSTGMRWRGGVVAFDRVRSLRPLNDLLPVKDLFGGIRFVDSGSTGILIRTLRIPSGSSGSSREVFDLEWTFPGEVVSIDRHGELVGPRTVGWRFRADPSGDRTVRLEVRWKTPLLSRSIARTPQEKALVPWILLLAATNLLSAILAWSAVRGARRRARDRQAIPQ